MTFQEFDKFFDELTAEVRGMRDSKGKEYAHDLDRFANFKRIAKEIEVCTVKQVSNWMKQEEISKIVIEKFEEDFSGGDPLVILFIYMKKHWDSFTSYVNDHKTHSEPIRGRMIDLITYANLGAGIIQEAEIAKSIRTYCPTE